eukprot:TCALIF_07922-PA protein Name:"Protein of unknown function" AED:0.75 eAED:0.75 QI:0/0/0/0.25/1/1/4/0/62
MVTLHLPPISKFDSSLSSSGTKPIASEMIGVEKDKLKWIRGFVDSNSLPLDVWRHPINRVSR